MPKSALTKYSFNSPEFTAYSAACSSLSMPAVPFHSMICSVEPAAETTAHNHAEPEAIIVISGTAEIRSGGSVTTVTAGEAVVLDPYLTHVLLNVSDSEQLKFLSVYWMPPASETVAADEARGIDRQTTGDVVLFSTPPTPNGGLHLGHFSGPYLAGDILRRLLSADGVEAAHMSGFDDHTSYVWTKSRQLSEQPAELAARFTASIRDNWREMGVEIDALDNLLEDPGYQRFCASVVAKLVRDGHVVANQADSLYEKDTGAYLHEALVTGSCPTCGNSSDGDACEQCGRPHEPTQLIDPVSTLRPEAELETRPGTFLYFRLEPHRRFLEQHVRTASMSDSALVLSQEMLAGTLPDIRISHDVPWGVTVSAAGVTDQRLYPWFEMGILYLWLLRARFGVDSLRVDDDGVKMDDRLRAARIVHCFGFDNCYFHTLLFPALFHALDDRLPIPTDYVVNELLELDGSKFSTSRNHLVSAAEVLAHTSRDHIRLYLAMIRPERYGTNFTIEDFQRRVNDEMLVPLNDAVSRFTEITKVAFSGRLPEPGAWTGATQRYHRTLLRLAKIADDDLSVTGFSTQRATKTLAELVSETVELLAAAERLMSSPTTRDHLRTSVSLAAIGLNVVRRYLGAIAPGVGTSLDALLPSAKQHPGVLEFFPAATVVADTWKPLALIDLTRLRPAYRSAE